MSVGARLALLSFGVAHALALAACGGPSARVAPRSIDFEGAVASFAADERASHATAPFGGVESDGPRRDDAHPESRALRRASASPAPTRRSGRRIDVRFDDADLENALRLLADAASLSIVIDAGLSGTVSDRLLDVDAWEALVAIASAHGAVAERRGSVVVVRRRD